MYESVISFRSVSTEHNVSTIEDDSFSSHMACKSGRLQQILSGLSSRNNSYFSSPTKGLTLENGISVLESFSWEERVTFLFMLRDIPQSICTIFDSYFDKQVFVFWMNVLLLRPVGITL